MEKKAYTRIDAELQTLLDLNGIIYPLENGYWVKFGAKKVKPIPQIPPPDPSRNQLLFDAA